MQDTGTVITPTWHALARGLQPLMSVNQIVNTGHSVTFDLFRVTITDLWNRHSLAIRRPRRRDSMWIVPFRVLKHLSRARRWHNPTHAARLLQRAKDQFVSEELIQYDPAYAQVRSRAEPDARTYSAKLFINPENTTELVQYLQECMGHAAEGYMCAALDHDPPLWTHTNLTSKQVRRAFRKRPCLWCALCKRNEEPPITSSETREWSQDEHKGQEAYDVHPEEKRRYNIGECVSVDDNGAVNTRTYLLDSVQGDQDWTTHGLHLEDSYFSSDVRRTVEDRQELSGGNQLGRTQAEDEDITVRQCEAIHGQGRH
jgi:hypothetical protein